PSPPGRAVGGEGGRTIASPPPFLTTAERRVDAASSDPEAGGTPTGVRAISRGLSEAIPPVWRKTDTAPRRGANPPDRICEFHEIQQRNAATPPGSDATRDDVSGGIAALNPRLIAETPCGVTLPPAGIRMRYDLLFARRRGGPLA